MQIFWVAMFSAAMVPITLLLAWRFLPPPSVRPFVTPDPYRDDLAAARAQAAAAERRAEDAEEALAKAMTPDARTADLQARLKRALWGRWVFPCLFMIALIANGINHKTIDDLQKVATASLQAMADLAIACANVVARRLVAEREVPLNCFPPRQEPHPGNNSIGGGGGGGGGMVIQHSGWLDHAHVDSGVTIFDAPVPYTVPLSGIGHLDQPAVGVLLVIGLSVKDVRGHVRVDEGGEQPPNSHDFKGVKARLKELLDRDLAAKARKAAKDVSISCCKDVLP